MRRTFSLIFVVSLGTLVTLDGGLVPPSAAVAQEAGDRSARDDDSDGEAIDERRRARRERFREARERFLREGGGERGGWPGRRGGFGRGRGGEERPDGDDEPRGGREAQSEEDRSTESETPSVEGLDDMSDVRAYARRLIDEHDQDGDRMLRGAELDGLGRLAAEADLDGDGVVTLNELVEHLRSSNRPGAADRNAAVRTRDSEQPRRRFGRGGRDDSGRERRQSASNGAEEEALPRVLTNSERSSYRFRPATERLPDGLPSFFSRDADGDGQISMHEFATEWDADTVAEFRRFDLNNDGVITPEEALQVLQEQ